MTSTMKSDAGTPAGCADACGVPASAAATAAEGRNAEGRVAIALSPTNGVTLEMAGSEVALAAPANAAPARNLRRLILDRGPAPAITASHCCQPSRRERVPAFAVSNGNSAARAALPDQRTGGNGEEEIAAELLTAAPPAGGGKPFVPGCAPVFATCSGALPGITTTRVPT